MWDNEEEFLAEMVEAGCVKSYDDEIIVWDFEKLQILYPSIYESIYTAQMNEIEESLSRLVDLGLLNMSFKEADGKIQPIYALSDKGKAYVESIKGAFKD